LRDVPHALAESTDFIVIVLVLVLVLYKILINKDENEYAHGDDKIRTLQVRVEHNANDIGIM